MAKTKGQYKVGLRYGSRPQQTAPSTLPTIAKAVSDVTDTIFNVYQKKQEANFISDFSNDVNKKYSDLKTEYQYDPAAMREQSEIFNKATLSSIPIAYRDYAAKFLASRSASNINYATNQKLKLDDENFKANWEITKTNLGSFVTEQLENVSSANQISSSDKLKQLPEAFNSNVAPEINTQFGIRINSDEKRKSQYVKEYNDELVNSQSALLYNMMVSQGSGNTKSAFDIIEKFRKTGNLFSNVTDKNQTTQDAINIAKDIETRDKIADRAMGLYTNLRNTSLDKLRTEGNKSSNIKIKSALNKEVGSVFHMATIKNNIAAMSNMETFISSNFPNASGNQIGQLVEMGNKRLKSHKMILDLQNGKLNINAITNEEKEDMATDILAWYNINDINTLLDPDNKTAETILSLYSQLNFVPVQVRSILAPESMNISADNFKDEFTSKFMIYERLQNKGVIDIGDRNNGLYETAKEKGWLTLGAPELRERVKSWLNPITNYKEKMQELNTANQNKDELFKAIEKEVTELEGSKWFATVGLKKIADSTLSLIGLDNVIQTRGEKEKLFGVEGIGEEGLISNNIYLTPEWGTYEYSPMIKSKILEMAKDEFLAGKPPNLDMLSKDNKDRFKVAIQKSLKRLDEENYGFGKYQGRHLDGKIKYTKDPFEKHHPEVSDREVRMEALAAFNVMVKDTGINLGNDIDGNPITLETMKGHIMTSNYAVHLTPVRGTKDRDGKPRYSLKIISPNGDFYQVTKQNEYFSATDSFAKIPNTNLPATYNNIKMVAAKAATDDFMKEYGHLVPEGSKRLVERAFLGFENLRTSATNFSLFVTDVPLKDTPAELKPFKYLFNLMGQDIDLQKEREKLLSIERTMLNNMSAADKALANMQGNTYEKTLEAIYPPHSTPFKNYNENMRFRTFVENNFSNASLPVGVRLNNLTGIKANKEKKYNGQLEYTSKGNISFARPSDSFEAAITFLYENSTLTNNNVEKTISDYPTVGELVVLAEGDKQLLDILKKDTGFENDTQVNLYDFNNIRSIMIALTKRNLGDNFNTYYGDSILLDRFIKEGFDRAKQNLDIQ